MINLNKYGENYPITFRTAKYVHGDNLYIVMISHIDGYPEPWSDLTVNLDTICAENCAFIDTNNNGVDILDWLEENNLGFRTGFVKTSGWCLYPEFCFDMEAIQKHIEE